MRPLLLLLVLTAGPVAAQDFALRIADAEPPEALALADLLDGLVAVTSWDDMACVEAACPVVVVGAVVASGAVVDAHAAAFVAAPVGAVGRGPTLGRARLDLPRAYLAARDETPLSPRAFPGENFFPEDEEAAVGLAGTAVVDLPRALRTRPGRFPMAEALERDLVRAAERMDREAFEAGESFLVFFAAPPEGVEGGRAQTEVLGYLRKRPGR